MAKNVAERSILPVTLGTAGHIDHGKTSLLRALAGDEADTDRLEEERRRGLTIDVGYAELALEDGVELGVVDVPGHEKFVRNMVAGATGIDVVLLVVAADDGVMPQTREHLQIMSLLGLEAGVIAITKSDLVDEEMCELVASEVEDLVAGTFLEGAPMIRVSSVTGKGIDELRGELTRLARAAPRRDAEGFFRMPVLRVFTSHGFGTIVTGIPVSGRVQVGDRVELLPGERRGRVRGLQVYHAPTEVAEAGHRTAINLAEVAHHSVQRGDVVCEPGVFDVARLLDVRLTALPDLARPLRHDQEVRLHVGTLECTAKVLLVRRKRLEPGASSYAQLQLQGEAVVVPGDPFIVRLPAELVTVGGGVVLGAGRHGMRRGKGAEAAFAEREEALRSPEVALIAAVRRAGLEGTDRGRLVKVLKRPASELDALLAGPLGDGRIRELPRGLLVLEAAAERAEQRLLETVERHHDKHPLDLGFRKANLVDRLRATPAVVDGLVDGLVERRRLETLSAGRIRLHGREPRLSAAQQTRVERILEVLAESGWESPRAGELAPRVGALEPEVERLLEILEYRGRLAVIGDHLVYLTERIEEAQQAVRGHFETASELKPGDLKQLLGLTRKYAIPLMEYFDRIGFTRRDGNKRVLR